MTAQMNLADLKSVLGIRSAPGEHIRYAALKCSQILQVLLDQENSGILEFEK